MNAARPELDFKLEKRRFGLDIRRKFFTMVVLCHWDGLYRVVGSVLSLEMFKVALDRALSNLL